MGSNITFDIVGSFEASDLVEFDPQQLVNLYVDTDPNGKNGKALFATPGLDLDLGLRFAPGSGIPGRRFYLFNDYLYAVVGKVIYQVNTSLTVNKIGEIGTDEGYVGIADNGTEIIFVDGSGGWLFKPSASLYTKITSAGFPENPTDIAVLGSRFIVNRAGTNQLHFSEIRDGLTWNVLDEFALTSQPDVVIGIRRLNDRLFVIGHRVTEVWYDAGEPVIPYRRSDVISFSFELKVSTAGVLQFEDDVIFFFDLNTGRSRNLNLLIRHYGT